MNVRYKIHIMKIVLSIALLLLVGLGLSSFFAFSKLKQAKVEALDHNLYIFERGLEDVRTCLDAEEFKLAQLRLQETTQLWKKSQQLAKRNPTVQRSFETVRKKYCKIWNDPEWNYRYRASDYPALQKEFEKICE